MHVVWATKDRVSFFAAADDARLSCITRGIAARHGLVVVAFGNAADHAHALVDLGTTRSLAQVAKLLKGGSAHEWNRTTERQLSWQDGYWAESIHPSTRDAVARYIHDQRRRHAFPATEDWEAPPFHLP